MQKSHMKRTWMRIILLQKHLEKNSSCGKNTPNSHPNSTSIWHKLPQIAACLRLVLWFLGQPPMIHWYIYPYHFETKPGRIQKSPSLANSRFLLVKSSRQDNRISLSVGSHSCCGKIHLFVQKTALVQPGPRQKQENPVHTQIGDGDQMAARKRRVQNLGFDIKWGVRESIWIYFWGKQSCWSAVWACLKPFEWFWG